MRPRVVIAMSGGVDSSTAALLLKEEGYDVVGVSLILWKEEGACGSPAYVNDAKNVCDQLGIPFYVFDHSYQFRSKVIDPFVKEYHRARTPNPCILCNRFFKFGILLEEAEKLGAKYLATGHHARIVCDDLECYHLRTGYDEGKDQSYFLFNLLRIDMGRFLFPVGTYTKPELRELAKKAGLKVHDKSESMEVCFIPSGDHASFIAKEYPELKRKKGNFVDLQGRVLGEHQGIDKYTIGQRKQLGISTGRRMYVVQIREETDEVVLGDPKDLMVQKAKATDFVFPYFDKNKQYKAKIRYSSIAAPVIIDSYDPESRVIEVSFEKPVSAVTPGQALVLYHEDEVVGGGWIG